MKRIFYALVLVALVAFTGSFALAAEPQTDGEKVQMKCSGSKVEQPVDSAGHTTGAKCTGSHTNQPKEPHAQVDVDGDKTSPKQNSSAKE